MYLLSIPSLGEWGGNSGSPQINFGHYFLNFGQNLKNNGQNLSRDSEQTVNKKPPKTTEDHQTRGF